MSDILHSSYLYRTIPQEQQRQSVLKLKYKIKESKIKFDAIVVRGVSGLVPGSILAYLFKKQIIIVRKKNDTAHTSAKLEGVNPAFNHFIIVDDFISTGETIEEILKQIEEFEHYDSGRMKNLAMTCAGIFLYRSSSDRKDFVFNSQTIPIFDSNK